MIYHRGFEGFGGQAKGYYTIAIVVVLSLLALLASRSGTLLATSSVTTASNEVVTAEVFYAAEVALLPEELEILKRAFRRHIHNSG